METSRAFDLISRAIDGGTAANAYLLCGNVEEECEKLVGLVLRKLYPGQEDKLSRGIHPDVFRLVPQGKSRTIKVERGKDDDGPGMRDGIIAPMSMTSFSGGWKTGIIVSADRMQEAAANAFLKTLEEPPAKSLFFLLTDAPEALLPTIVSRSQRIDLPLKEKLAEGDAFAKIEEIFSARSPVSVFERNRMAEELASVLESMEKSVDESMIPTARSAFFRTILSFVRDWMKDGSLELYRAFRNIEAVETASFQTARSIGALPAIAGMMDRMAFP